MTSWEDVRFGTIRCARTKELGRQRGHSLRGTDPVAVGDAGLLAHQRAVPVDLPADRPGLARLGQLLVPPQAVADPADRGTRGDLAVPAEPGDREAGARHGGEF